MLKRKYVLFLLFFFLVIGLYSQECSLGVLQYKPEGSCNTQTRKCCGGVWGEWGESKCICPKDSKPEETMPCVACGVKRRSVKCDDMTGNWSASDWGSCERTVEECCNASVPKTNDLCYKDCNVRVVAPYGEAKTISSGRFFCTSKGAMSCAMEGPEESRCYGFATELEQSGRPPGIYKCKYIQYTSRSSGTCEYSSRYCVNMPGTPVSNYPPAGKSCSGPCLYGIGTDGRGDGTKYDEIEISYKVSYEKDRCKVPGW